MQSVCAAMFHVMFRCVSGYGQVDDVRCVAVHAGAHEECVSFLLDGHREYTVYGRVFSRARVMRDHPRVF